MPRHVPASTSMLASFKGSSNEHKAGANIFRNADMVFQFEKMMRFTDKTLIEILEVMRAPKARQAAHPRAVAEIARNRCRCCAARCASRLVPELLLLERDKSRIVCLGETVSARGEANPFLCPSRGHACRCGDPRMSPRFL